MIFHSYASLPEGISTGVARYSRIINQQFRCKQRQRLGQWWQKKPDLTVLELSWELGNPDLNGGFYIFLWENINDP